MLPWTKTHRTSGQTGKRKRESASANGDRPVMPSDDMTVMKIVWDKDKKSHWQFLSAGRHLDQLIASRLPTFGNLPLAIELLTARLQMGECMTKCPTAILILQPTGGWLPSGRRGGRALGAAGPTIQCLCGLMIPYPPSSILFPFISLFSSNCSMRQAPRQRLPDQCYSAWLGTAAAPSNFFLFLF